ncbi:rDNA transcriptional regulator pol5-like [Glycine soja]|uniref:DNA polymerase V n=1 Tax=Glycine soja TaxID=3848 RepID=A0A445GPW7_GLYSO|nr:rDNA transcriptional regulator pol5-like [Glycine soja]RZB63310.1 DNA polymerase V [Glycine soja]
MGSSSKKRSSATEEQTLAAADAPKPLIKKPKNTTTDDDSQQQQQPSVKPMERKKKRKALDKERRRTTSQTEPEHAASEPKPAPPSTDSPSSSGGVMPEFHIGVFKDLAAASESAREAAAKQMVTELKAVQNAYDSREEKESGEGGLKLEAEKDDGLDNCASSVRYAVRRLIRGVSSSRECARQGFALGLTVLAGTVHNIKVDSFLKLVVNLLEVTSSMKGQEAKDCLLGRLFAYGALARSGRLTQEWNMEKSTPYIREFISVLISLANKKRYLQEPAVSIILDLVEKLPVEALVNHVLEAPGLQEWFEAAIEVGNPDALLLALKVREKISIDSSVFGKLLPNPFSSSQLFSADHLSSLSNCLKESTFCQPRVHSVWPVLINILLPNTILQLEDAASASNSLKKHKKSRKSSSSDEEIAKNLQNFCEIIIEGSLLISSHDRKHLAFDVLFLLLQKLPASLVPVVLSNKVVQCLVDVLSTKNTWLFKVAQHFLKQLSDWVGDDDVRRVSVIVAIQKHSNGKFDRITRTKHVKDFMSQFKTEPGCMLFIQNLMNLFVDEGNALEEPSDQSQTTDENSEIGSIEDKDSPRTNGNSDFLKSWVIESLPSILKFLKLDHEEKFRVQKEIMKFLAVQGLFTASLGSEVTSFELQEKFRWPKSPTSNALCKMCIDQLQLLLANAQKGEGSCPLANSVEPNDLGSYFMKFFGTLCNIPSVSLFRSLDDVDQKAVKKLQAMETRLSREERSRDCSTDANRLHALRYLLIQLLLQVLLHPGEFSEAASELVICCKKAFSTSDLPESSGEDDVEVDDAPELMDVLVDTLLSLLPQSSAPMRSSIEQVFKYFCGDITNDGLMRMLRVIKKNLKPARHPDAANADDDDDEDDDFIDIEEEEIDQAETGETGESDGQTDDSESVVEVEETDHGHSEASDDSDSGMDDDAMFRIDTYLAQIFKEKKNQAGGETAHSQLVLFKLRILSLLEIFLHENPGKPQVLMVYSNLAQAFVNPHTAEVSEQLGQRIWGILQKQIFKAKDYPRGDGVQLSSLESLLEKSLKLASKPFKRQKSASNLSKQSAAWNRQKMISSLAQTSTFWILKIIDSRNFAESELERIVLIFREVLVGYFDKKSQIKSGFLKEIIRRRPWIGHAIFGFILERCGSAKSDFRRVEALELVMEILKSLSTGNSDEQNASKKILKNSLDKLSHLLKELVTNMPSKPARRTEVQKFCVKALEILSKLNLTKNFVKTLAPDTQAALEAQLGEQFISLKKLEK